MQHRTDTNRVLQFDRKAYLRERNKRELEEFKLSNDQTLTIKPISVFPGQDFSKETLTYSKVSKPIGTGQIIVIKKNGVPISCIWETTAANIKKAVSYGVYKPEALTGQVLHAIGGYRPCVFMRAYEEGIVSNKYEAKQALLEFWQKRVELLQPLERLINTSLTQDQITAAFETYIRSVQEYKSTLESIIRPLKDYDVDIQEKLERYLQEDSDAMQHFLEKGIPPYFLDAAKTTSLFTELRVRMVNMAKQAQGINQNLAHAHIEKGQGALLRGDFNDVCEDVMQVLNTYDPDLHNVVLLQHQGDFTSMYQSKQSPAHEEEKTAGISSSQQKIEDKLCIEFTPGDKKALAAICHIEEADRISRNEKKGEYFLASGAGGNLPLTTTRWTAWFSWIPESLGGPPAHRKDTALRAFYFICNVISGILLTVPDIFYGLFCGLFSLENRSLVEYAKRHLPPSVKETSYSSAAETMEVPAIPLAFRVTSILGRAIRALAGDLARGILITFNQVTTELWAELRDDYKVGGDGDTNRHWLDTIAQLESDIEKIKATVGEEEKKYLENKARINNTVIEDDNKQLNESQAISSACPRHLALPPYHLSAGEWEDLSGAVPEGLIKFMNAILLPIHVKNPFIGLLYNGFYVAGGLSVIAPHAVPLSHYYKDASQWLGAEMAHNPFGQAISSAVTQGQSASMLADFLFKGPNSMLGKIFHTLEDGIVDIGVIFFAAFGMGVLFKEVPLIGKFIEDEVGEAGSITLATYGGKIGLILYELCIITQKQPVDEARVNRKIEEYDQLIQNLTSEIHKLDQYRALPPEKQQALNDALASMPQNAKLRKFQNAILQQPEISQALFLQRLTYNVSPLFLHNLTNHAHLLPYLPTTTKREILQDAAQLFNDHPKVVTAIREMLYPDRPNSIATRTLSVITGYVMLIVRIVPGSVLTGNYTQPFQDAKRKITKDLARLMHCIESLGSLMVMVGYAAFYSPLRALADILFNGILARAEGLIRSNKHSVSDKTTEASAAISSSYARMGRFFTPSGVYQKVTSPDANYVIGQFQWHSYEENIKPSLPSEASLGKGSSLRRRSSSE
jgi:hypothetical protein